MLQLIAILILLNKIAVSISEFEEVHVKRGFWQKSSATSVRVDWRYADVRDILRDGNLVMKTEI